MHLKFFVNMGKSREKRDSIPLTLPAMVCPGRFYSLTFLAPSHPLRQTKFSAATPIILVDLVGQLVNPALPSGVNGARPVVAPPQAQETAIERPGLA